MKSFLQVGKKIACWCCRWCRDYIFIILLYDVAIIYTTTAKQGSYQAQILQSHAVNWLLFYNCGLNWISCCCSGTVTWPLWAKRENKRDELSLSLTTQNIFICKLACETKMIQMLDRITYLICGIWVVDEGEGRGYFWRSTGMWGGVGSEKCLIPVSVAVDWWIACSSQTLWIYVRYGFLWSASTEGKGRKQAEI